MPQDEGLDDAPFPETLGALGGAPAPARPADEPPTTAQANADAHLHDGRAAAGESRRDRVVGWLQWAAAPLGFSVFLLALTLFGLLKDEPTTDPASAPAPNASGTRSTAPSVATTVPDAPTTTAAPTTEPPTTRTPATEPSPSPGPGPLSTSTGRSTSPRFGPVCGYLPGETVDIMINGEPAPSVTADAEGCVTVYR